MRRTVILVALRSAMICAMLLLIAEGIMTSRAEARRADECEKHGGQIWIRNGTGVCLLPPHNRFEVSK